MRTCSIVYFHSQRSTVYQSHLSQKNHFTGDASVGEHVLDTRQKRENKEKTRFFICLFSQLVHAERLGHCIVHNPLTKKVTALYGTKL